VKGSKRPEPEVRVVTPEERRLLVLKSTAGKGLRRRRQAEKLQMALDLSKHRA